MVRVTTKIEIEAEQINTMFIAYQSEINEQVRAWVKEAFEEIDWKKLAKEEAIWMIKRTVSREMRDKISKKFEEAVEEAYTKTMQETLDKIMLE